jgi:hypothetical protein
VELGLLSLRHVVPTAQTFWIDTQMRVFKARQLLLPLVLVPLAVQAATDPFDDEYDRKPWAEIEVQIPAFPAQENLIPFTVGAVRDKEFSVDGNSLSVGSDGVVRYTLVIVSASGARNISYEGIRCSTTEMRYYASGRPDGTWSKARGNDWRKIRGGSNNHHVELYFNYFCSNAKVISVWDADEARRVLRNGGNPTFSR